MLIDKVADFKNLLDAFNNCARGKRKSFGFQDIQFDLSETLLSIRHNLIQNTYDWGGYRVFTVIDPKARQIMAASFKDRIVHHAICQVIGNTIDSKLSDSVYACRKAKGNKQAALKLWSKLKQMGPERYVCKVDVSKYFESINHEILMESVFATGFDKSIYFLIDSLLKSHPSYAKSGVGIPIGNLTSQCFANFYLAAADKIACEQLGVNYFWEKQGEIENVFYIRYMDDSVFVGKDKKTVTNAVNEYINFVIKKLYLRIGYHKIAQISKDPVPFLGYVLSHDGYRVLSRNIRRNNKQIKRLKNKGDPPSKINEVRVSYKAWSELKIEQLKGYGAKN